MTKRKIKKTINYDSYIMERFAKEPEFLKICLKCAFDNYEKDRELPYLLETLRHAASVKSISWLAKETDLSRTYLYKMLSEKGNPTFSNFELIIRAFGYGIEFKKLHLAQ